MRTHHSLGSLFRFLAWLSVAAAAVIGLSVGILIAWTHTAAGDAWITRRVEAIVRETVPGLAVQRLMADGYGFGGEGDLRGTLGSLTEMEIAHHLITRSVLDRREARPGREGHWEWHASALGRATPIVKPRDTNWKVMA